MRKQYHLQPSKNGFMAWDISKLIEASENLNPINVEMAEIRELDENYWYNSESDIPTCRTIAEHMKLAMRSNLDYPIILSDNGRVMDGMHRVIKAYFYGQKTIKALKFKKTPPPDFVDVSLNELTY